MLAAFFMTAATAAAAEPPVLTAAELQGICQSKYDTDSGLCAGYITAIADQLASAEGIDGRHSCTFGQARAQQFTDLFLAYAESYPDALHAPARSIAAAAITRAFPCRQ
jgi:hypothetical protein